MIFFPRCNWLKCWTFWILYKSFSLIPYLLYSADNVSSDLNVSQVTEDFLGGFIAPWFYGAGASSFTQVCLIAVLLDLYIAIAVLLRISILIPNVKNIMWVLFALAMYTIWLEPWLLLVLLNPEEWMSYLVSELIFKGVLFFPDAGFSILWFIWTWNLDCSLNNEFRRW